MTLKKKNIYIYIYIGHKFLNTPYKNCSRYIIPSKTNHNHQRDQHGYQRNQKGKKKKNHQEHVW